MKTIQPFITRWDDTFFYPLDELEHKAGCIYLKFAPTGNIT